MSPVDSIFNGALLAYILGAMSALAGWRRPAVARLAGLGFALAGSLLQFFAAAIVLARGTTVSWVLPFGSSLFPWILRVDPLAAYFNLALAILAFAVSVYSLGYLQHMESKGNLG